MAVLKIGEREFAATRPSDLDGVLLRATGCTAAETAAQIARFATPFAVARAVQPFLAEADAMPVYELAELIAEDSSGTVINQVVELLSSPAVVPPNA